MSASDVFLTSLCSGISVFTCPHMLSGHTPRCSRLTRIFLSLKSSLWPVSFSSSQSILLSWLMVPAL